MSTRHLIQSIGKGAIQSVHDWPLVFLVDFQQNYGFISGYLYPFTFVPAIIANTICYWTFTFTNSIRDYRGLLNNVNFKIIFVGKDISTCGTLKIAYMHLCFVFFEVFFCKQILITHITVQLCRVILCSQNICPILEALV